MPIQPRHGLALRLWAGIPTKRAQRLRCIWAAACGQGSCCPPSACEHASWQLRARTHHHRTALSRQMGRRRRRGSGGAPMLPCAALWRPLRPFALQRVVPGVMPGDGEEGMCCARTAPARQAREAACMHACMHALAARRKRPASGAAGRRTDRRGSPMSSLPAIGYSSADPRRQLVDQHHHLHDARSCMPGCRRLRCMHVRRRGTHAGCGCTCAASALQYVLSRAWLCWPCPPAWAHCVARPQRLRAACG